MIARALLSGNAHQPLNVATMLNAHQQVTQIPQHHPIALPPAQPPLLPSAPMPPKVQDGTVIQTQAIALPPAQPPIRKLPRITKQQQRAIAIVAGIATALWVMDAIIPGLPGRVISGVQSLYRDAPTLPATEAPATETESTAEPSAEPEPESETQTFDASPDVVERMREALQNPAAPTQ